MDTWTNALAIGVDRLLVLSDGWMERALATGQALPWVVSIGLALLVGALAGEVAARLRLARVQGYWLAGMLCAAVWWAAQLSSAPVPSDGSAAPTSPTTLAERFGMLRWVLDMALGWLLVQAGRRLDVQWLWRNPALLVCALLAWVLTAAGVSTVLASAGVPWRDALLAGVVFAHASPVLLQALMQSLRAEGQVSERSLQIAIIGLMLTALLLPLMLTVRQSESWRSVVSIVQPLMDAILAVGLGALLGALVRWISEPPHRSASGAPRSGDDAAPNVIYGPALVGAVLVVVGVAHWSDMPALPGCVALGWALRGSLRGRSASRAKRRAMLNLPLHSGPMPLFPMANLRATTPSERTDPARWLGSVGALALVLAFMAAGAILPWGGWIQGVQTLWMHGHWPPSLLHAAELALWIIGARFVMALLAIMLTASLSGLRLAQSAALALTMQSSSVTAVALWAAVLLMVPQWDTLAVQALAIAIVITEFVMPLLVTLTLRALDEAAQTPAVIEGLRTGNSSKPVQIDTEQYVMSRV
jgi:hypothetical protein